MPLEQCLAHAMCSINIFLKILIIYFQRGEGREREREKHQLAASRTHPQLGTWHITQASALTGIQISDL